MSKTKTDFSQPRLPVDDPTTTGNGPQPAQEPSEAPRKAPSRLDPALSLAAKLDRLMAAMPQWARVWAIGYLKAKYLPVTEAPDSCA